ncbi:Galactokinase [Stereum hirsutum FP-91666 SS1]|uniref:Galactokinase n=1 Tax=Stereum hirsutum (strain FP-91666) TaxID=721885 RepID=UPI000440B83D|nr:Galactokinase [Stereum hirsutum FP-91666 SS1]EIM91604.1 Galactokinase [Stereum hirsutum FP-91666 SS1]
MAAQLSIPIYTSLDKLYNDLGTAANHATRWNNLAQEFEKRYGRKPKYIARAPGRVNLIGEHIDYALFGVFPAAIEPDILIACAPHPPHNSPHPSGTTTPAASVNAQNLYEKYTPTSFVPIRRKSLVTALEKAAEGGPTDEEVHVEEWHMDIDKKELRWESYVKAGYYGVLNRFFDPTSLSPSALPVPVDLLVTGTVPAASGLSSSAAMVVASTLAFLAVNDKLEGLTKGQLVEMAMENEQRVGVNSGGMDQAASVISTPASALYVTFYPKLAASLVPLPGSAPSTTTSTANASSLPPKAVFIIANSLVTSEKAVSAKWRYNLRVVETLVAARVLAHKLGLPIGPKERITLREVVGRVGGEPEGGWGEGGEGEVQYKKALERMVGESEVLKRQGGAEGQEQEGVTREEMVEMSGLDEKTFKEVYLDRIEVEATYFQLYKRAKHVFTEALRVLEFRDVCLSATASASSSEETLVSLGNLMKSSQTSCSSLYECSCTELDALTALAVKSGAYGSRLTGAGWGGCTVSLVREDKVDGFVKALLAGCEGYKEFRGEGGKVKEGLEARWGEVVFATKPSSGACVYKFEE